MIALLFLSSTYPKAVNSRHEIAIDSNRPRLDSRRFDPILQFAVGTVVRKIRQKVQQAASMSTPIPQPTNCQVRGQNGTRLSRRFHKCAAQPAHGSSVSHQESTRPFESRRLRLSRFSPYELILLERFFLFAGTWSDRLLINSVRHAACGGAKSLWPPTYVFAGMTTTPLSVTRPYSRSLLGW